MSRPSKWIAILAFGALLGFGTPTPARAQDSSKVQTLADKQTEELTKAADLIAQGKTEEAQRHLQAAEAYRQAAASTAQNQGMVAELERMKAQIERDKAAAEATRANQRPGWLEQIGVSLAQQLIQMLMNIGQQKLQDYLNKPSKELEDQIRRLEEERGRLEEELANAGNGPGGTPGTNIPGLGPVITDPNGTTGYDRDGDGYVDIPTNPDGSLGNYTPPGTSSPTDPITGLPGSLGPGASSNTLDRDEDSPTGTGPLAGSPGAGGSGSGAGGGPSFSFGGAGGNQPGAAAGAPGAAGTPEAGEEKKEGEEGAAGGSGGLGGSGKAVKGEGGELGKSKSGDDDPANADAVDTNGRVLVLQKLEFEDLAGNKKPNKDWKDEWEDDKWDDKSDNGDLDSEWANDDDWGSEWDTSKKKGAKKAKGGAEAPGKAAGSATTAEDKAAAELVDQIIRVETVVAEWRKLQAKAKEAGVDPYGFKDDAAMGYESPGGAAKDPFKDVRTPDGKIDLTKVDVWLIKGESWKDGEEPQRFRLKIDAEEITDFDPIHGGVATVRGVVQEITVDQRVLDEIKGKVKEIKVIRVIASAEKPVEKSELTGEPDAAKPGEELPKPADTAKPAEKKTDKLDNWDDEGW